MSRFRFAAGNGLKLVLLPAYAAGSVLSRVVPRDPNRWSFGSGIGLCSGPLALVAEAEKSTGCQVTWLATSRAELADAREAGLTALRKRSVAGYWQTLRSGVLVVTHGFGDVNRFATTGAFTVDLHHGTPIKLLHLDSPATFALPFGIRSSVLTRLLRYLYVRSSARLGLFVAASPLAAERFATAYHLRPEQIAVTGDPRMDSLAGPTPTHLVERLLDELGLDHMPSGGLVLYAPTWRDGQADPIGPSPEEWDALDQVLGALDAVLVVRSHPLGFDHGTARAGLRVRYLPSSQWTDITPVLGEFAALITDYSAIGLDFAVTSGPMVFFAPDLADYESTRGFYEPYETLTEGEFGTSWSWVVEQLKEIGVGGATRDRLRARTERLRDRFVTYRDGASTRRLLQAVNSIRAERQI